VKTPVKLGKTSNGIASNTNAAAYFFLVLFMMLFSCNGVNAGVPARGSLHLHGEAARKR